MYVKFVPVPDVGERLAAGTSYRPELEWDFSSSESSVKSKKQVLGRNGFTQIADQLVSRQLATVEASSANPTFALLTLLKAPKDHYVSIQGKPVTVDKGLPLCIHQGDRIFLYQSKYEYICHITQEQPQHNLQSSSTTTPTAQLLSSSQDSMTQQPPQNAMSVSTTTSATPTAASLKRPATSSSSSSSSAAPLTACASLPKENDNNHDNTANDNNNTNMLKKHELAEEAMCSICMDIMVQATSIVPCGHMFCKSCLGSIQECPTCRTRKCSATPSKSFDNMIWHLVRSKYIFQQDDVLHYLQRSQQTLTNEESQQILGQIVSSSNNKQQLQGESSSSSSPLKKRRRTKTDRHHNSNNNNQNLESTHNAQPIVVESSNNNNSFGARVASFRASAARTPSNFFQAVAPSSQVEGTSREDAICID